MSLRIPSYGSRNLAYIAGKMDYMRPLWRVRYKPYWVYCMSGPQVLAEQNALSVGKNNHPAYKVSDLSTTLQL